ncbi:MAG: energy-coupling factor transporter ATP-binding protein EcfA2, partial [Bacillariaceae sp.]
PDNDYFMEDVGADGVAEGLENMAEGATMPMTSTTNTAVATNSNNSPSCSSSSSSSGGWQVIGKSGDDDANISSSNNNDNDSSMSCDDESESKEEEEEEEEENKNSIDGDDEFNFDMDADDDEENKDFSRSDSDPSLIVKAFDVDLLRDCIKRSEDSLKHIDGKDVVLIVGKTGTGKSTFIQGIAGKTFKKSSFSCDDKNLTAKDVFEAENPIPGFEIGHAKSSMTKHIKFFLREENESSSNNNNNNNNINTNDSNSKKEEKEQNRRIHYLDTPGFADTSGEEIDIATSSILNFVAKKCKTLRFVIIINYVSLLEDRGGSLRSILKFMRKFVSDFDKNKQSFMFLFSHADEIKDVPESLEGAKQSLLKEIIRTIDGTEKKDVDVIELLNFIQISLKKKFPFVDILHPLKTDFKSITEFIEKKLKPIKVGNENGTSCDLTGSSKMRLSGAVRKMLVDLRLLLKNGVVNIAEVRNIQTTFQFFEKYIHFEEMRGSVIDCNDIIGDHVKRLRGVAGRELRNGTTSFTAGSVSPFNKINAADLKDALLKLQAIDLSFDLQTEMNRITNEVTKYQKGLFIDVANDNFNGFSQDLQKLQSWCIFDPDYQELYDPVIAHAITTVKQVSDELSKFDTSQICSSSESALKALFFYLKVLKSVHENVQGLSLYIPEVSDASNAFNNFLLRLKSDLQAWENYHSPLVMEVDFGNKQAVEYIATQIRTLQMASGVIREADIQDDIVVLVGSIQTTIEFQVVGRFTEACSESKQSYHELDAAQWSERLAILRDIMSTFSDFEGSQWKEMEFSYKKLVDGTKSLLKAKSGELDEMSNSALDHGVGDGARDGKAVCSFASYQWFDNFLPQEERFVQNCTTKIRNDYFREFLISDESIGVIILRISSLNGDSESLGNLVEATKELNCVLPKIVEYKCFGSTIGDRKFSDRAVHVFDKVRAHIRSRVSYWKDTLNAWVEAVSGEDGDWEKLTASTEILDFAISEMNEVIKMPCGKSTKALSKSLKDETMAAFSNFNQQVQGFLDSQMSYEEFASLLARVQALGYFPSTAPHLPKVEDLKEAARQRISSDAKNIEDMVEQTSQYDVIDSLLEDFQKAAVLDIFVSQEVSSRLRPLKRLRIEKEVEADGFINEMIEKNDFSGLGGFLLPLVKSKDQIKQLKFRKVMEKISDSVDEIDRKLQDSLFGRFTEEKGQQIVALLKIIEQVNEVAGEYLPKKRYQKSMKQKLLAHKEKINRKCDGLHSKMVNATKFANFVDLASLNGRISIVLKYLGPYIKVASRKKVERAISGYNELKSSIPSRINKFT